MQLNERQVVDEVQRRGVDRRKRVLWSLVYGNFNPPRRGPRRRGLKLPYTSDHSTRLRRSTPRRCTSSTTCRSFNCIGALLLALKRNRSTYCSGRRYGAERDGAHASSLV